MDVTLLAFDGAVWQFGGGELTRADLPAVREIIRWGGGVAARTADGVYNIAPNGGVYQLWQTTWALRSAGDWLLAHVGNDLQIAHHDGGGRVTAWSASGDYVGWQLAEFGGWLVVQASRGDLVVYSRSRSGTLSFRIIAASPDDKLLPDGLLLRRERVAWIVGSRVMPLASDDLWYINAWQLPGEAVFAGGRFGCRIVGDYPAIWRSVNEVEQWRPAGGLALAVVRESAQRRAIAEISGGEAGELVMTACYPCPTSIGWLHTAGSAVYWRSGSVYHRTGDQWQPVDTQLVKMRQFLPQMDGFAAVGQGGAVVWDGRQLYRYRDFIAVV